MKMWHEVRKQERKIRCMIVDYKRRAERRKDYYEKIKADPTQFLQIHGRPCKIHLDPAIAAAGDSPANMMAWQGNADVLIDRFDVRAHLDFIQEFHEDEDEPLSYEDRHINYERYRILVQNDFLGVSEEKFLHQLHVEEQFGASKSEDSKKKGTGVAIGLNYDDPTAPVPSQHHDKDGDKENEEEEDDSDIDFDVCVDVNKVSNTQANELNKNSHAYGMESNDFFSFLTKDREEADNLRLAKEMEEEKAMYSGRKSRRERRAYREKKLAGRVISPPSYASRKSPTYRDYCRESRSKSKSPSPENSGKITYITSFSAEEPPMSSTSPKPKLPKTRNSRSRSPDIRSRWRRSSRSRSKSRSRHTVGSAEYRSGSSWQRKSPKIKRYSRSPTRSRRSKSRKSSSSSPPRKTKTPPSFEPLVKQPPPPVISRYYGRRGKSSSSELSLSDDDNDQNKSSSSNVSDKRSGAGFGNSSGRNKPAIPSTSYSSQPKLTPQERLKRKMQAQINRQYKLDKKAEREKREKVEQERIDREDEMREISIKLRKRERMRRHEHLAEYERRLSDSSRSPSRSRSMSPRTLPRQSPSRSRSRSPASRRREREREREKERARERERERERERRRRSRSRSRERSRSSDRSRDYKSQKHRSRPLVDY